MQRVLNPTRSRRNSSSTLWERAFLVIVGIVIDCLLMIGRGGIKPADKKWAKELLSKQLAFLGGVVGEIILRQAKREESPSSIGGRGGLFPTVHQTQMPASVAGQST